MFLSRQQPGLVMLRGKHFPREIPPTPAVPTFPDHPVGEAFPRTGICLHRAGWVSSVPSQSTPNPAAGLRCPARATPGIEGCGGSAGTLGTTTSLTLGVSSVCDRALGNPPGMEEPPHQCGGPTTAPAPLSAHWGLSGASLQEHLSVSHNSLTTLHGELSGLPCLRVSVPLLSQGFPGV